ncbi:MAG: DMT family transporter [Alphaproteobacteria bacterium]|nr:DMT family transporter [Alphaproteobacteria bacterium]
MTSARRPGDWLPYLLLTLAACFWGLNGIIAKIAVAGVSPAALAFLSWCVGIAVLAPFALPRLKRHWRLIARRWWVFAALGVLGMTANQAFFVALSLTTAINAQLIGATIPAAIIVMALVLYRETPTWRALAGMAIAFLGVAVVVVRGDPAVFAVLGANSGDLVMIISVLAWACYTVVLRHVPAPIPPVGALWLFGVSGTVFNALVLATQGIALGALTIDRETVLMIAYVAVFPAVLGFLFYNEGVRLAGATIAGQFMYLSPIITAVLAVLILGEDFRPYHVVGMATIFGGVYLASTRPSAPPRPASRRLR